MARRGIHNEGALTLIDSTVEGNAAGNNGGGIFNDGGVLLANGSAISSNDKISPESRRKILWDNAAKLFGITG